MEPSARTILLVDDEEPNRLLLSRRLTNDGYAVTAVEGGLQAIEMLRQKRFDLILLDLLMPGMDGLATLDAIKSDPALKDIPLLMLTASSSRDAVVHCISMGAADYVIKPINPDELRQRVRRHLRAGVAPA